MLALEALLLLAQDVYRRLVVVVHLQQLALLALDVADLSGQLFTFFVGVLLDLSQPVLKHCLH
ncbi:hypothetical protein [Nesterenkonia flava]|uniref:Uncharacterized protein n=1 Tax=Nesterenkonia flava TaxID=469799 RepID=A0ABU1FTN8_9MICC|nr:hypothetical protein [Nesterenkonia flava]MDR5712030.1 hypothetical protein [Nesterenkonia flava]